MKKIIVLLLAGCLMFAGCEPKPIPDNPPESSQEEVSTESSEPSEEQSCEHEYKEEVVSPACTEMGYTTFSCSLCGYSYTDNHTPPTGHLYSGDGFCVRCGFVELPQSPPDSSEDSSESGCDHTYTARGEEAPSCDKDGYTLYVCEICGGEEKIVLPKTNHKNISLSVSPTCTAEGYEGLVCEVCGWRTVYNTIKPKGHKMEVTVIPPTCNEKGFTLERCSECGEEKVRDYVEPTGEHSLVKTSVVVPPTSESDGYTEYRCLICGETVKGDIVPKEDK